MKKWPIVTLAVLIINSSLPLLAVETATARSIATNGTTEAVSSLVTDLSAIEETTTKRLESDMASSNRPDSQQLADTTETASSLDSTTESSTSSETTTASESSENEATRPQTVSAKPDINAAETNEEAPFVARTIPTAEKNPKEGSYANGNWGGYGSGGTRFTYYFDTRELVIDAGYVPSMHPQAVPWLGHHDVKKITFNGPLTYDKTSILNRLLTGFFKDLQDVTTINGLQYFDMSNVTAMNEMFKNCYHLKKLDLSSWDTQNVSFFNDMFNGCLELADLQIANFDISLGSQFQNMFNHCDLLTDLDISNWKGVFPKTIFVDKMFSSLKNLNSISLPSGEQLEINADLPFIAPNEVYTGKYSSTAKPTLVYSRTQLLGSHTREAGVYVANKQLYGVRVTYTDENDHSIRSSQTILGYYHDPYDATTPEYQLTLPGYTLVGIPKNTTGILDNSVKSVDYIYRKFVTPVVETNDSVMYAGQTYDAKVNFVKGTDHLGNALAWNNPGLTVGGDTVDTQTPGVYHKTLTYKFEKAETVTSSYTVTVKADQTAANLQDVKLYVDDKFDANAPLKKSGRSRWSSD
ncbi:BspA family leucine-rich repeat surface protein [Brochothrix campestris]|uniref:Uncharacterized protein n=1 Tax=Brochothrix campestris FSL F6-1037 TaxID=1265861 RepID=W7CQM2_9LIST|nr:BspA family leucine-rich repeat surface protein [Brochothrix campestris]EUJ39357.1 hypothetical protein BCAMP_07440 [Brochothrix campestris FSL F6-1037]